MILSKPSAGDTDWAAEINQNWAEIDAALTHASSAIPFSDGSSLISDATKLSWDNSNKRLGLGTSGPDRRLDILDASNPQLRLTHTDGSIYCDIHTNGSAVTHFNTSAALDCFVFGASTTISSLARTINAEGTVPGIGFYETDADADEKVWDLFANTGIFDFRMINDAISAGTTIVQINRAGYTAATVVWNESGVDIDFRAEGDTATHLLFVDASADRIGINTSGPDRTVDILDSANPQLRLTHTDGSVYVDFQADSSGILIVSPSGISAYVKKAVVGNILSHGVLNDDNSSASSHARLIVQCGGSSAGDPYALFRVGSATDWCVGVDNSDSDNFKISQASAIGANDFLTITTGGKVGVNQSSPSARLEVVESSLNSEVFRIQSTATNDDPSDRYFHGRVATTDGTVTTINTVAISASTTVVIEAHVRARRTGGASGTAEDGAGYVIRATYKNAAGTATLIGAVNADYTAESQAAWDATFTISGSDVLLRVTGAASNNISWHSTIRVMQVSS